MDNEKREREIQVITIQLNIAACVQGNDHAHGHRSQDGSESMLKLKVGRANTDNLE